MKDRYPEERTIAPKVEPQWAETFIVALRLRGVAGEQISDALAEVNDHIAESGRTVEEAFGPASQYAGSLDLPCDGDNKTMALYRTVIPAILGTLGTLTAPLAVKSWRSETLVVVSTGAVVSALLAIVIMLALPPVYSRTLPKSPFVDRTWKGMLLTAGIGGLLGAGWMALVLVPFFVFTTPLVQLPALPVFLIGIVFLTASTVLYLRLPYREDPLEPPLSRTTAQHPRFRGRLLLSFMFPFVALVFSFLGLLS